MTCMHSVSHFTILLQLAARKNSWVNRKNNVGEKNKYVDDRGENRRWSTSYTRNRRQSNKRQEVKETYDYIIRNNYKWELSIVNSNFHLFSRELLSESQVDLSKDSSALLSSMNVIHNSASVEQFYLCGRPDSRC